MPCWWCCSRSSGQTLSSSASCVAPDQRPSSPADQQHDRSAVDQEENDVELGHLLADGDNSAEDGRHPRIRRLYPPGNLLHVVRVWDTDGCQSNADGARSLVASGQERRRSRTSKEPRYAALWTDWSDYEQIQLSPVMVHDHMPEGVIDGLEGVGYRISVLLGP